MSTETRVLNGLSFTFIDAPAEFEGGCTVEVCGLLECFNTRAVAMLWVLDLARRFAYDRF